MANALNLTRFLLLSLPLLTTAALATAPAANSGHQIVCPPKGFESGLVIHQLYVGQGDAALIRTPSGRVILIDGGDQANGRNVILPTLKACYPTVKKIDYVVLSHPHIDHFGGLIDVFDDGTYPIGTVILPTDKLEASETGSQFKRFMVAVDAIKAKGTRVILPSGLGEKEITDPQVTFNILAVDGAVAHKGPLASVHDANGFNTDDNAVSIAMTISLGNFKFFTAGDLTGGKTATGEGHPDMESVVAGIVSPVDVYKANHHGSDTSNKQPLLDALKPTHVLVSVGAGGKNLLGFHLPRKAAMTTMNAEASVQSIWLMSHGQSSDILPVGKFPGLPKVKDLGGSTGTDLIVSTNASGSNYTISAHSFSTAVMNTIKK